MRQITENKKFDIVMFSMSSWYEWKVRGRANRNWHILSALVKYPRINKILSCDLLPHNFKKTISVFLKHKRFIGGKTLKSNLFFRLTQIADNLYVYSAVDSFIKGEEHTYNNLKEILKFLDFKNIILWSYNPMFSGYFEKFGEKISIFDAVDNWLWYPGYEAFRERIKKNYEIIEKKADLIFTVSRELVNFFKSRNQVFWIPNGVDLEAFSLSRVAKIPSDIKKIPKPIAGYTGHINRINIELVRYLIKKNKNVSFVFIGPVWKNQKKEIGTLEKYSNVYFLGEKPYSNIPDYVRYFDICIVPHKLNQLTRFMDPLKIYEYLALGKPIVATSIPHTLRSESSDELFKTAETKDKFLKYLRDYLYLEENKTELIIKRRKLAEKFSWKSRVEEMFKYIDNYLDEAD